MANLEGWARPTDYLFLEHVPGGADHTYVVSSGGEKFGCGGGTDGGSVIASGEGSHTLARKLARHEYGGMVYGVTGVCHQMANRALYPCGRNVYRAKGAGWSYTVYGVYGQPHAAWLAWKTECEAEIGVFPIPYGIPLIAIPPRPRWPQFAASPGLDLAEVADSEFLNRRTQLPEGVEFAEDEWGNKEMLSVRLLAEAAGARPEEIANAELESFIKVRTDGRISDVKIREIFQVRDEFDQERWKLISAFGTGKITKIDFVKYHNRLMVAEFSNLEKVLGAKLYEQIYDLPADHSPGIFNPGAFDADQEK